MNRLNDARFKDSLVELIYSSLIDGNWQNFLDGLNGALHLGKSTFLFYDSVKRQGHFSLTSGYSREEVALYNTYYNAINPWMPKASVRSVGIGVTSDQMYDPAQLRKTEFYNDYLLAGELEGGAGLTVFRDHGRSFVLTTLMSAKDHESSRKLASLFTDLSPHLARAFSYYRKGTSEPGSLAQSQLLDLAGIGLLVVDEDRRLKAINETGKTLTGPDCGIRIAHDGRIAFVNVDLQEMLKMVCRRIAVGTVNRVEINNSKGCIELTMVRLPSNAMFEFLDGPSVAILLKPLSAVHSLASYGLSGRETEVAKAILVGKTIQQIADERGVSRETVRTQLKSVFAKLDVTSQTDLVRKFCRN